MRILNHLLLAILVVLMMGATTFIYLFSFDANPPTEFRNLPFPTDKASYVHGERIRLYVDQCRHVESPTVSRQQFVDTLTYNLSVIEGPGRPKGCASVWTSGTLVSDNLPPGHYYLQGINEYEVNFLATRYVTWRSQEFEVVREP